MSSKTQNYATQRDAIERAAAIRGDTIEIWYAEKKSAKTVKRPELDKLGADARAGRLRYRRVYCFKLDRLTRSGIRDTLQVISELQDGGVELVFVADGFDLSGPCAEIIIAVMSWASKMELMAKNERIAAARLRMESEGKAWGRPKRMDDATIAKAKELRAEGRSLRQIAVALTVPKSTIGRMLASQNVSAKSPA
ncbi:MAG: recombinase family protein [Myxococcales bacterium]|nr:recombinase family protein [Myxococcales bacterium]